MAELGRRTTLLVFAALLLGETLTSPLVLAGAAIILGVIVAQRR